MSQEARSEFGMVGLGTMGRALLQNVSDHGFAVSGWNRHQERLDLMEQEAAGKDIQGFTDLAAFVASIRKPRVVMLLVPAGDVTDEMIGQLVPLLEADDFIIDGSNAYYKDTDRRSKDLATKGFGFLGLGVSGGETGARYGPSMMAGGTSENYERVKAMLEAASAKYDGEPCVALLGPSSAGHYVKMVHNGIEYGIMQVLAECYDFMFRSLGMKTGEIADVFGSWDSGLFKSFLLEISEQVLRKNDPDTGKPLVELILDQAKAKGTGKWTSQDSMDLGVPVPTIDAAVNARELSAARDERLAAAQKLGSSSPDMKFSGDRAAALADLQCAMQVATLSCYAQGMSQLRTASADYGYALSLETVAKIWRAGCIIRSELLETIRAAYSAKPDLWNLLTDDAAVKLYADKNLASRRALNQFIQLGLPCPGLSASLSYIDGYRSAQLPANFTQAQRDLFGAHTYQRIDKPGDFHTEW